LAKDGDILLGLLGQSLGHSLSPVIHQAFFDELGLSGRYDKIEVADAEQVPATLEDLAAGGYSGINVTIPYKLTVLPQLAALDESATLAGAANTIKFAEQPTGYNTDTSGLAEALSRLGLLAANAVSPASKVVVLGCGGAARAAIIAVSTLGFKKLVVLARNEDKARTMLDQLQGSAQRQSLIDNCAGARLVNFEALAHISKSQSFGDDLFADTALVINATPVGQKDDLVPDLLIQFFAAIAEAEPSFVDLVYSKTETPLCKAAREAGFAQVEDGKEMLINQARLAFKIWTGQLPDGELARTRLIERA